MKLLIIWLLNLFDYICTIYTINLYGIDMELNPMMRYLFNYPILCGVVKLGIPLITCVLIYLTRENKIIKVLTWLLLLFYGAIAVHHLINLT